MPGGNCPALPGRNLISTCNRRVRSVPAGRGEISSGKPESCNHPVSVVSAFSNIYF